MIEVGRYYNMDDMYRTCVYCDACVEDEYHFLIVHCIIVDRVSIYLLIMQTMSALSHCTYTCTCTSHVKMLLQSVTWPFIFSMLLNKDQTTYLFITSL